MVILCVLIIFAALVSILYCVLVLQFGVFRVRKRVTLSVIISACILAMFGAFCCGYLYCGKKIIAHAAEKKTIQCYAGITQTCLEIYDEGLNIGKVPERDPDLDFWLQVTEPETPERIAEQEWLGQLELLAQIVHAEAGNQDLTGKRLVADVVLNRVDDPRFPNTIEEVIFQPGQFQPMDDGAFQKAAWNMMDSDYEAVWMEVNGLRIDSEILYFSTTPVNGTRHWKHGGHWFSY